MDSSLATVIMLSHPSSGSFKIDNRESEEGNHYIQQTVQYSTVPCCPVVCWGCARRWVWRRWPWPFGTGRSGSFCAHGLRLEESHCTWQRQTKTRTGWMCKRKHKYVMLRLIWTRIQLRPHYTSSHTFIPDHQALLRKTLLCLHTALMICLHLWENWSYK